MAQSLRQLLDRRAKITREMRELADGADDTGLTAEQQAAFDKLKAALADLETAISNRAAVDDAERRLAGTPVAIGSGRTRRAVSASCARSPRRPAFRASTPDASGKSPPKSRAAPAGASPASPCRTRR